MYPQKDTATPPAITDVFAGLPEKGQQMEELIELQDKLADAVWKNSLKGLADKEKEAQIQERINGLLKEAEELEWRKGGTTADTLEDRKKTTRSRATQGTTDY